MVPNKKLPVIIVSFRVIFLTLAEHQFERQSHYNIHEMPPSGNNTPVLVTAQINLRNILEVHEKQQLISLETTLRLYWKDPRVTPKEKFVKGQDSVGRYVGLNPIIAKKLWMPDIFVDQVYLYLVYIYIYIYINI